MQIDIRGQNVAISGFLAAHCVERFQRALRPFSSHVSRVQLVFVDLNGPKKGQGQACRLTVQLSSGSPIRFESRAEDYYQSASEAIDGVVRRIRRRLERLRDLRVGAPHPTLPAA